MFLQRLEFSVGKPAPWQAYTICTPNGRSELLEDIERFLNDANLADVMRELLGLLDSVLMEPTGPQSLQGVKTLCHEAVAGTGIYEFVKRPLRLYWFYGEDRKVIIVPAVHHKKQQTTPKQVEAKLRKAIADYRISHSRQTLTYL